MIWGIYWAGDTQYIGQRSSVPMKQLLVLLIFEILVQWILNTVLLILPLYLNCMACTDLLSSTLRLCAHMLMPVILSNLLEFKRSRWVSSKLTSQSSVFYIRSSLPFVDSLRCPFLGPSASHPQNKSPDYSNEISKQWQSTDLHQCVMNAIILCCRNICLPLFLKFLVLL